MSTKRTLLTILAASAVLLALGIGFQLAGAQPPVQRPVPPGVTIPYPSRLNDAAGQPVPDGTYDFTFTLYATETGGAPLWSETQAGVPVQGGAFQTLLGAGQAIPPAALTGSDLWLEVAVRGPGEAAFTTLAPRQRVSAAAPAPDSPSAGLACPHDHWGEVWSGSGLGLQLQSSDGNALVGYSAGSTYAAVYGRNTNGTGTNYGVYGRSDSTNGHGVYGYASAASGITYGVYGRSNSTGGVGVVGHSTAITGVVQGVIGRSDSPIGRGVAGVVYANSGINYGVYGWTQSPAGYAGYFDGNVHVAGTLSKSAGGFMIDHPLDPQHKYLYHSFVESPDMKNIYDGVVTLGEDGTAWVQLPEWFQALNQDFRYQLTPIGAAMPNLHIAEEIQGNQFKIAGGVSGKKVSWQVTGIRHDPYAGQHRIPVEQDKPADEQNTYLYPEGYGQSQEKGLNYQRNKHLFEWPKTDPLSSGDE